MPSKNHKCPICGKASVFSEKAPGPFCSERCRLVDLGRWLGEEYKISEDLRPDHFLELEEEELSRPGGTSDA